MKSGIRIGTANLISAAALVAGLMGSVQAQAQTSGDVVMRRPLLGDKGIQSCDPSDPTCTPTPTPPPTPTPTPTPAPTPTPTPTPPPTDPNHPICFYSNMQWTTDPWTSSNGQASQCGQQTTLSRNVGCSAQGTCYASNFSSSVQVDGPVDPAQCESHIGYNFSSGYGPDNILGPEPLGTYTGTGAGCSYTVHEVSATDWQDPGYGPVDHQCSADTYQDKTYDCTDSSGQEVPFSYCTDGVAAGGTASTQYPSGGNKSSDPMTYVGRNFGNLSDCHYGWTTYDVDAGGFFYNAGSCDASHQFTATLSYTCTRTDGMQMPDEDCAMYPKPSPTYTGACVPSYYNDSGDGFYNNHACRGDTGASVVIHVEIGDQTGAPNGDLAGIDDSQACYDAGATCCELRAPSGNYAGPDQQLKSYLYGTTGFPTSATYGQYSDASEPAADPSQGYAQFIATQSGSLHWVSHAIGSQGLQIKDPQNVLWSDRNGGN